jgi:hypothetical protein
MMMSLLSLLRSIFNTEKNIDVRILPSQGLFYNDDFSLKIKKADISDIIEYEYEYIKDDISIIINKVKTVVEKNIKLNKDYQFEDIKSIDIIFIFLEIVRFTKKAPIRFIYLDGDGKEDIIEFDSEHFNYFYLDSKLMDNYNKIDKCFDVNGYKYTLPSIGIESSLTNFLIDKVGKENTDKYSTYFYDFTYFIKNKNKLTFEEIENLIQIFNFDIEEDELKKINNILNYFLPIQKYSLIKNGSVIDITAKIDLEKIWK